MKYNIGLALSGGGVKGFAHAGALKALEERGIIPDIIAGTSAGAVVAALYAGGNSPEKIVNLFNDKAFNNFVELNIPKNGLFKPTGFVQLLKSNIKARTFEELKIPIKVVSTNLDEGRYEVFSEGDLIKKVTSSACVPVIFNPIEINGHLYADGGIFKNFPVSVIRDQCRKVIGINASPLVTEKYSKNIVGIAERSYHFMFRANTMEDKRMCDILVEVESVMQFKTFDLNKVDIIFQMGYEAMSSELEKNPLLTD